MPYQALPVGEHGSIKVKDVTPAGHKGKIWRAQCRYRDHDGAVRQVSRTGPSRSAAENNLKTALRQRSGRTGQDHGPDARLHELATPWFAQRAAEAEAGDLAKTTLQLYERAWRRDIAPAMGQLRLREITVSACERWQNSMRSQVGASQTRTARSVLSQILGYAARLGAMPANPCRDMSRIPGGRNRKPRAMTRTEIAALVEALERDPRAVEWGVPDLVRFMLATGCRIGEALAVSWDEVDLDAGTVAIRWHLVRITGDGLHRMPGAKSEAGDRVLRLPRWAVDVLMRRRVDPDSSWPVFPNTLGTWRDPADLQRVFRESRRAAGFGWVTSHVFRQTVITVLDAAGLSTREVADQVGHARVDMTQAYMARKIASTRAAEILEDLL